MASSRREKGTGGYRKLPNGKIQYIKRGEGAVTAVGSTKKEALANAKRKLEKRNLSWSTSRTLEQAWKEMEPELCKTLAPTNYAQYQATLKLVVKSHMGRRLFSEISGADLLSFAERHCGNSPTTKRNHVARVRAVLNRLGHRVTVAMPKPPRKEKTTVWGSDSEEFLLWVRSLPENRRLAVGLLYLSGLRRSEACGLRYEDMDKEGAFLRRSVTETEDAVHVRPRLKTDDSVGYVTFGAELAAWIGSGKGYILTGTAQPMKPRSLTQLVRRAVKGTKWANLTPQSLRRGFGQAIWEKTDNALLTASMMRHSLAMTEREYVQVDRGIKKRAHDLVFKPIGSRQSSKRKSK